MDNQPSLDRMQLTETLVAVSSYPTSQRQFCRSCGLLLGEERKRDKGNPEENCHRGHVVKVGVFEQELKEPTRLLNPVDDNKSQAVSDYGKLFAITLRFGLDFTYRKHGSKYVTNMSFLAK